jgi:hypothetical protein
MTSLRLAGADSPREFPSPSPPNNPLAPAWQVAGRDWSSSPLLVLAALGGWGIRENRIAAKRHALRAVEATVALVEQLAAMKPRGSTNPRNR